MMARMTFSKKSGRIRTSITKDQAVSGRAVEDIARDMKRDLQKPPGEDYREKSLAIHGLICARCAREFDESNRHLLTVHHKDGNHMNNPLDGSNWENLCVYCHEDIHGRDLLGDFFDGSAGHKEEAVVYTDDKEANEGVLGKKLTQALREKKEKKRGH
jgi:hypothetical protein